MEESFLWPFDFEPYDIQKEFMQSLYRTLENGKIGIFESPTGTGKSLSIICAALHWLSKNRVVSQEPEVPSTVKGKATTAKKTPKISFLQRAIINLQEKENKKKRMNKDNELEHVVPVKRLRVARNLDDDIDVSHRSSIEVKTERILQNYNKLSKRVQSNRDGNIFEVLDNGRASDLETQTLKRRKIFICSRTHSQLSQFVSEINRTPLGKILSCVALASKKHLCVNPTVNSLKTDENINDRCTDLCSKKKGCKYKNMQKVSSFADYLLKKPSSIEESKSMGIEMTTCSFYSSREALLNADVIIMPYAMILDEKTRIAMGIDLSDNIVVFDEAHNLIEALSQTYSCRISKADILSALEDVKNYLIQHNLKIHFQSKLHLQDLVKIMEMLNIYFAEALQSHMECCSMTITELVMTCKIENFNLFKLAEFLLGRNFPQRIKSYIIGCKDEAGHILEEDTWNLQSVSRVIRFLSALQNPETSGRILLTPLQQSLEFVLLDVSTHLRPIISTARSVIFAGGTMKPYDDLMKVFAQALKCNSSLSEKVIIFSCGHVVPRESITCLISGKGPTGKDLTLNFHNREKLETICEVGMCLLNICSCAPSGAVIFFPSYAYLDRCVKLWKQNGIFERINKRKEIFFEEKTSDVKIATDPVLDLFTKEVQKSTKGAILFTVVGGKLSEGINFSNELCRCVCVVGMPFPNPNDALTKLKIENFALDNYLQTMCMKSVNQCIGRAIRNKDDYAAIVLLDSRYGRKDIKGLLPPWVINETRVTTSFGSSYRSLMNFFKSHLHVNK